MEQNHFSLFLPISSVQSLSRVRLFVTPWIAALQASLSITNSRSLLKLMSIKLVMPSSHLILCRPLLLPTIPPRIRVFSMSQLFTWGGQSIGVSDLASVLPMNTRTDLLQDGLVGSPWLSLGWVSEGLSRVFSNTTVQQHQFFGAQVSLQSNSHIHVTTGRTIALTRRTFVGEVMSLLFNMLSTLVKTFLSKSLSVF